MLGIKNSESEDRIIEAVSVMREKLFNELKHVGQPAEGIEVSGWYRHYVRIYIGNIH